MTICALLIHSVLDPHIWMPSLFLAFLYVFPTLLAIISKRKNSVQIAFVNLFLGWTIIGWIVAVAWACDEERSLPGS